MSDKLISQQPRTTALGPTQRVTPQLAIFDNVPSWAIVHAARDNRSAPLICEGEVVVVEGDGCTGTIPEDGGLYLIEHVIAPHSARYGRERRVRKIVQVCRAADGSWWARPYSRQSSGSRTIVCSDGPYTDEIMLAEKILGPVEQQVEQR